MGVGRWVSIGFLVLTLLLAVVTTKLFGALAGLIRIPDPQLLGGISLIGLLSWLVAGVIGFLCYRNEKLRTLATEVANELKKVTWPNWKDTRAATIVVIILTVIISLILFLFDAVWSKLTGVIYT